MSIETKICEVSVDELRPFKDHPYKVIDDGSMTDLAESIRERGVIVPIVVRPIDEGCYEIISGHRRAHAAKLLGIDKIPAKVVNSGWKETVAVMKSHRKRERSLTHEQNHSDRMKNELLLDDYFVRCSTLIAELLMKYKCKEVAGGKKNEESEKDSSSSFFARILLKILLSSYIIFHVGY